jgi:hypothetical protein
MITHNHACTQPGASVICMPIPGKHTPNPSMMVQKRERREGGEDRTG